MWCEVEGNVIINLRGLGVTSSVNLDIPKFLFGFHIREVPKENTLHFIISVTSGDPKGLKLLRG